MSSARLGLDEVSKTCDKGLAIAICFAMKSAMFRDVLDRDGEECLRAKVGEGSLKSLMKANCTDSTEFFVYPQSPYLTSGRPKMALAKAGEERAIIEVFIGTKLRW